MYVHCIGVPAAGRGTIPGRQSEGAAIIRGRQASHDFWGWKTAVRPGRR